jgi:rhodanese-related sulfurtransferase
MRNKGWKILLLLVPALGFCKGTEESQESPYTDPGRLAELIRHQGEAGATPYILVDVRTPEEYVGGHVEGALNIPHTVIGDTPPTTDRGALIIVYCRSGARSDAAKQTLDALGYSNVVNFGSLGRWTGELVMGDQPRAGVAE